MSEHSATDPAASVTSDTVALRATLRGGLLEPFDADYDSARIVWNGMIDRRPALIARCRGAADVIAALAFARSHGMLVAVRGGGHNSAGYAVCDGGMMIDLSDMRAVRVDPAARLAWVQGGATWGDVDCETCALGLATPGGLISQTGVGGLTLAGGIGWLRGSHGLCIDNLEAVDIVVADGRFLHASAGEHPDLFWAIRGGGGNFGIVTGFTFRLHPIEPALMLCAPAYPASRARELLPLWRDFMARAPDALSSIAEFSLIPDDPAFPERARGQRALWLTAVYDGPAAEGDALVQPLRSFGTPIADFSGPMPYPAIQTLYDTLFPKGRDRAYFKSLFLRGLDDAVIGDIVGHVQACPSPMAFITLWPFAGAVQRVAAEATAFGDRSMSYLLSLDGIWSSAADDAACVGWVRGAWDAMQRHSDGRMYMNFAGGGEGGDSVRKGFGAATYARLAAVKRQYDPNNLFRMNQNVLPA